MTKALVATIGFDEKFIIRMITREGLNPGDKLFLYTLEPVGDKALKAIRSVRDFVFKYHGREVEVKEDTVNVYDFADALLKLIPAMRNIVETYDEIVINLSGGMRILIIELLLAVMLACRSYKNPNIKIEVETENFENIVDISMLSELIFAIDELTRSKIKLLKTVADAGEIPMNELARRMNKDLSSISRQAQDLIYAGLLEELSKRPKTLKLTPLGRILLETYSKII